MADDQPGQSPGMKSDVWDYVRRRNELDREIQEKFSRPVTVMFTDIKGSTTFFDMRGDLEGVTMLQRHNDLVIPPIEQQGGRVLQRLGDGLLAVFPAATPGVKAAIEIQRRLQDYNSKALAREQIDVRVGLNSGMAMVEEANVFGDAVNTAARVQTLAEPGQILVSESTCQEAGRDLGRDVFLPVGPAALKGKLEKVVVFEVLWSPEQARVRAAVQGAVDASRRRLRLDIARVGARLSVTTREVISGEPSEPRVADMAYDEAAIGQTVQRLDTIVAGADREGRIAKQSLEDLAALGRLLWEQLLPADVRSRLMETTTPELTLGLDEALARLPWELLHDGREFLCLRFGVGRVISGARPLAANKPRESAGPLKLVVVGDAQGMRPDVMRASAQLGAHLGDRPQYHVVVNDRPVQRAEFVAQFTSSDLLHLAGSAGVDGGEVGILLADGRLSPAELGRLTAAQTVPRLVFVALSEPAVAPGAGHATASAALATAMLATGVTHLIVCQRAIAPGAGVQLAQEFYQQLAGGQSLGLALRDARREVARRHGKADLTWAAAVLYGDPGARYVAGRRDAVPSIGTAAVLGRKRLMALLGGAAAVVVVAGGLYVALSGGGKARIEAAYQHLERGRLAEAAREFEAAVSARPAEAYEGLALIALRQNDAASAQKFCGEVQRLGARRPGCVLVHGDAVARRGDLAQAAAAYDSVVAFAGVPSLPKAIAYNRLGRLAAEQGEADRAQSAYHLAQQADPASVEALSNMGALLRRQGKYAEATAVLEKAAALGPNDAIVQTLLKDVRDVDTVARDADKQKRIDTLVAELASRFRRGEAGRPPAGRDDWTSPPLTISLLGFESRGRLPFREGEYDFLNLTIGQTLESQTRARLVERAVMDKLLAELNLSSSVLVDRRTALQLGRVLSARLIGVGSVAGDGTEWTVTMRIIETETSAVVASIARTFPATQSTAQVADAIARDLAARLHKAFPLRARVTGGGKGEVTLNVGRGEGAVVGQKFLIFREAPNGRRDVVGEAEITEVAERSARAKLFDDTTAITPGLKALERI